MSKIEFKARKNLKFKTLTPPLNSVSGFTRWSRRSRELMLRIETHTLRVAEQRPISTQPKDELELCWWVLLLITTTFV